MYLIIVGAGGIGQKLAELAIKNKDDVVIIDKDQGKCDEITKKYDVLAINGDATEKKTLEEAGIGKADAVVTTTDDAVNLLVMSLAKNMGVRSLVSVVNQEESKPMFMEKGTNIVGNPDALTAEYLYRAVRRPSIKDFMPLGGQAEIFKISLSPKSKLVGKTLGEIHLPKRVLIVAIERDSNLIIPIEETKLAEGDSITVLARKDQIDKATAIFSG
jgi:trk system potassium uptake protein TrkA